MPAQRVADAYSRRAAEYVAAVGLIEHVEQRDLDEVLSWARSVDGPVLDVGCGPGQWTERLRQEGVDIEGIDPSGAFIDEARARYPLARFRAGIAESLDAADASIGGILAWFSLIHTDPADIDVALREFARALAPGAGLFVGFFAGDVLEPFDHAITTAYYWPAALLTGHVERAGFSAIEAQVRTPVGARTQGVLRAVRARR